MSELRALLGAVRALRRNEEPFLIATVVRVRGSAYRRPGARMVITQDRWLTGSISGGCLEGDVITKGWWRTRETNAAVVTYDATSDDDARAGFGLGCNGAVDVLLERFDPEASVDPLTFVDACLAPAREHNGVMVTIFRSDRADAPVASRLTLTEEGVFTSAITNDNVRRELQECARAVIERRATEAVTTRDGSVDALVEWIAPPPHLFIAGSGHDASPVMTFAKALGWSVTVCDAHATFETRSRFAAADRFLVGACSEIADAVATCARAVSVVMGHNYDRDRDALAALIASRASFIGVLGPRARTKRMLDELTNRGVAIDACALRRIRAPVGIDLGAETPTEIALSIIAEIQAALSNASARSLRDRTGAIHDRARSKHRDASLLAVVK